MRLLIAEDDRALGLFLSRGLEADGHRVRLVYDGGAAMDAFRQEMPDLTILDLNMPVKDGEQVLEEFRAMDADLPVLVLTARQEVDTRVRCMSCGRAAGLCCAASARLVCFCAPGIWNWTGWTILPAAGASRSCSPIRNFRCSST